MRQNTAIILSAVMLCEALWVDGSLAQVTVPSIESANGFEAAVPGSVRSLQLHMVNENLRSRGSAINEKNVNIFDGEWERFGVANETFSISLRQAGSKLIGQYCAIANNGNKIDCDPENNPNITGNIDGRSGVASLTFSSFFGATNGKATIVRRNGRLIWHVVEGAQGGESYVPLNAVLRRN